MNITVLLTAPYMIPFLDRFKPVFEKYDIDLIVLMLKKEWRSGLVQVRGPIDGAVSGDDRFSARRFGCLRAAPQSISKWGTGSIP